MAESVSIVVPVRNRAALIGRCLDSILMQSWRPLRVYVVDNNSTDNTSGAVLEWMAARAVTERDPDFSLTLLHEATPGASAARNCGLAEVDTEYVLFFDSDDEMLPTLVERALGAIGDADLVYWRADVIHLDGVRRPKAYYTDSLLRRHFYNAVLSTQVFMARTSLVRRVGGWQERAAVWNDWELGVRIALASPRVVPLDETLTLIYSQEESITGRSFSEKTGVWERTLDIVEEDVRKSDVADKRRLYDMLDYRRAILAAHYRREGARDASAALLSRALGRPGLPVWRRALLRALFGYTALGGRGAYYLWRK